MWVNPTIGGIEPDAELAVLAPCRSCRLDRLLSRMAGEVFARRGQLHNILRGDFADEQLQKARTFEPPVPEQFGIERNHDDWIEIRRDQSAEFFTALLDEMHRVRLSCSLRCGAIVQFLFRMAAGDPVVFHAGKLAHAARDRAEMLQRQIETDVAIEVTICWIARVTFVRAPDLPARIAIAGERRRASARVTRRVNRAVRLRVPEEQAVRIE